MGLGVRSAEGALRPPGRRVTPSAGLPAGSSRNAGAGVGEQESRTAGFQHPSYRTTLWLEDNRRPRPMDVEVTAGNCRHRNRGAGDHHPR